jgi:hypothetical protein
MGQILRILVVGATFLLAGCSQHTVEAPPFSERDSAGVRVLTYSFLPPDHKSSFSLSGEPLLKLGTDPESEFYLVAGVQRLTDGRIVVADGGSLELRFFDSTGRFIRSAGGEGEGPGEFRRISWIGRGAGDSLWVSDEVLGRLQIFSPDGTFVRTESLASGSSGGFGYPQFIGILETGDLVATRSGAVPVGESGPVRTPSRVTVLNPREMAWTPVLSTEGPEQIVEATENGFRQIVYTFGNYCEVGASGETLAVIEAGDWGFETVDREGALSVRVEVLSPDVLVDDASLQSYAAVSLAKWPAGASQASREAFRRRILTSAHRPVLPKVRSVEVDAGGRIWIEPYPQPGVPLVPWEVFDRRGEWLSRVELPPGFKRGTAPVVDPGVDIGSDFFLGVWVDELGVETVRLYGIVSPG